MIAGTVLNRTPSSRQIFAAIEGDNLQADRKGVGQAQPGNPAPGRAAQGVNSLLFFERLFRSAKSLKSKR
jgi:hypothetical protein